MKTDLKNKKGKLTAYAFACGYVQQKEVGDLRLSLWRENGSWHIRAHDFSGKGRLFWHCPKNLTDARKAFAKADKELFSAKN
jgi:hypothetical protein